MRREGLIRRPWSGWYSAGRVGADDCTLRPDTPKRAQQAFCAARDVIDIVTRSLEESSPFEPLSGALRSFGRSIA